MFLLSESEYAKVILKQCLKLRNMLNIRELTINNDSVITILIMQV